MVLWIIFMDSGKNITWEKIYVSRERSLQKSFEQLSGQVDHVPSPPVEGLPYNKHKCHTRENTAEK